MFSNSSRRSPIQHCLSLGGRALVLVVLVFTLTGLSGQSAKAGVGWCRLDPIVMIDGNIADIFVAVPLLDLLKVNGPTEIIVTTPPDVSAYLILPGVGFLHGEIVTFETSPELNVTEEGIDVWIQVYVPARKNIPVLVEFAPHIIGILWPTSAEGTANSWVSVYSVL